MATITVLPSPFPDALTATRQSPEPLAEPVVNMLAPVAGGVRSAANSGWSVESTSWMELSSAPVASRSSA